MLNIYVAALKYHFDPQETYTYKQFINKLRETYKQSNTSKSKTFEQYIEGVYNVMLRRTNKTVATQ